MAKDISQAEPAPFTSTSIPSLGTEFASRAFAGLLKLTYAVIKPRPTSLDTPLPPVDETLLQRVIRVERAIEHARQNGGLKLAVELLNASSCYSRAVGDQLQSLQQRDRHAYWKVHKLYTSAPQTEQDHMARLAQDFALAGTGSSTIARCFHFRNNAAERYIWVNRKEESIKQLLPV